MASAGTTTTARRPVERVLLLPPTSRCVQATTSILPLSSPSAPPPALVLLPYGAHVWLLHKPPFLLLLHGTLSKREHPPLKDILCSSPPPFQAPTAPPAGAAPACYLPHSRSDADFIKGRPLQPADAASHPIATRTILASPQHPTLLLLLLLVFNMYTAADLCRQRQRL